MVLQNAVNRHYSSNRVCYWATRLGSVEVVKNLQDFSIDHQQFTKSLEKIFSLPPPFFSALEVTFLRKFLKVKCFSPNGFSRSLFLYIERQFILLRLSAIAKR
jgi:hypothetical protein